MSGISDGPGGGSPRPEPLRDGMGPGTGPGLVDRDIPPPGCADDLLTEIARDTEALLHGCEIHLRRLEATWSAKARYRAALAKGKEAGAP